MNNLSKKLNINLTNEQLKSFETYYNMLIEKNKVMNLTAITDRDEVIMKHFIDSISVMAAVPLFGQLLSEKGQISLLDVGTGAGFPGIPLKIAFPDLKITLLDSLNKRVLFLNEVISTLGLFKSRCCTSCSFGIYTSFC